MKKLFNSIYAWFFPNSCVFCGEYTKPKIYACKVCMPEQLIKRNFNIKVLRRTFFFQTYSLDLYQGDLKDNVEKFKFNGKRVYAKKFAKLLWFYIEKTNLKDFTAIAFVPMSKKKQKTRHYNQAEILAKELSKISGITLVNTIKKVKENRTQHTLSAIERAKNVKGVYSCTSDLRRMNILIVDDIITTGSTICECAKVVYNSGADNVVGISIGRPELF